MACLWSQGAINRPRVKSSRLQALLHLAYHCPARRYRRGQGTAGWARVDGKVDFDEFVYEVCDLGPDGGDLFRPAYTQAAGAPRRCDDTRRVVLNNHLLFSLYGDVENEESGRMFESVHQHIQSCGSGIEPL